MVSSLSFEQEQAIRTLATDHPQFKPLFEVLASRVQNRRETELDRLLESPELESTASNLGRSGAIEFFRGLERATVGEFRVGRRGKATRFIWSAPLTAVAKCGRDASIPGPNLNDQSQSANRTRVILHTYVLRPEFRLEIALPSNLTSSEAKRVANFIQSLPFDTEKEGIDG